MSQLRSFLKFTPFAAALLGFMLLGGCGSSSGSGDAPQTEAPVGSFGVDENGIRYTGSSGCVACHQLLTFGGLDPEASAEIVADYLRGRHAQGSLDAAASQACFDCHDPIGDGTVIAPFLPADASISAAGLAAVGCENCHGAGGDHFGDGPLPRTVPGFETCGKCHDLLAPGGPHIGAENNLLANYQGGRHATSVRFPANALCGRCHSDEIFRNYYEETVDLEAARWETFFSGVASPSAPSPVQCRTCHNPHSGALRTSSTVDNGREIFSREFNLCTACHQVNLEYDFDSARGTYSFQLDESRDTYLATSHPVTGALIEDTHFKSGEDIFGYNIDASALNACTQCHNPHAASRFSAGGSISIAEQWSRSGHADYQGGAFTHEFDLETGGACLNCHNGMEFVRFVNGVAPVELDASKQGSVVACVACHDLDDSNNDDGALRLIEEVVFPSGRIASLGHANNLCLECHQGRSSTRQVDERIADNNFNFSGIHFSAAGASLFGSAVQGGYEYPGRSYRGWNSFSVHEFFGAPELTTCTGCHMQGEGAGHDFSVNIDQCYSCHSFQPGGDFSSLGGSPSLNFDYIQQLMAQLEGLLVASGVQVLADYPYFSGIADERQLKAAYNLHFARNEPGGYVHNGVYLRQLLYDSIVDMGGRPVLGRPVLVDP